MRLNNPLLRARRTELGLTSRALARAANVSMPLIKRLETTGDVATLQVGTLTMILEALSIDLADAVLQEEAPEIGDSIIKSVGGFLQEHGRGVTEVDIARTLGLALAQVESALTALDVLLRPCGMRIHRNSSGVSVVPSVRPDAGSKSEREKARHLSNLNRSDVALLHRITSGRLLERTIGQTNNATVNIQKLTGAGLVEVVIGFLLPTSDFKRAIGSE